LLLSKQRLLAWTKQLPQNFRATAACADGASSSANVMDIAASIATHVVGYPRITFAASPS
jgi:hypothetical protein